MRSLILLLKEKGVELLLGGLIGLGLSNVPAIFRNSSITSLIIVFVLAFLVIYFWIRNFRQTHDSLTLGKMIAFKKVRRGVMFTIGLHSAERGSTIYLVHEA